MNNPQRDTDTGSTSPAPTLVEGMLDLSEGIRLPWIDGDGETEQFIEYWFSEPQRSDLRRLAYILSKLNRRRRPDIRAGANVLRLALSRIIITNNKGASRDPPGRTQINVCRSCLEEKMRLGEWDVEGARIQPTA